jgi:hypothetical protein
MPHGQESSFNNQEEAEFRQDRIKQINALFAAFEI